MTEAAVGVAQKLAATWAHAWRCLHCHREDPAAGLLTPAEVAEHAGTIAATEAALHAFQIEPDDIPQLADQPDERKA